MSADFQKKIMSKHSFPILAGPCVIESEAVIFEIAEKLTKIVENLKNKDKANGTRLMDDVVFIFKASFDKANRSSINGFRGPGLDEGLEILSKVKKEFNVPVVSDIHEVHQAKACSEVLDILQIPAFLCRQTDLIVACAQTQSVLNIKKGQFLSPAEVINIHKKCVESGNDKVFICERGNSFGYNNLVVDMRMFEQVRQMGIRTIFDATHSCQLPGAGGDKSLGMSEYAPILARAAVAAGATGLFTETHPRPSEALSDGPNMIPLEKYEEAIESILKVRAAALDLTVV